MAANMKASPSLFVLSLLLPVCAWAADPAKDGATYADPAKTDADFPLQGEYTGVIGENRMGIQVIALGDGKFRGAGFLGGLPGDGWQKDKEEKSLAERSVEATREGDKVTFTHDGWVGVLTAGKITLTDPEGNVAGDMTKVERQSPTLGAKAPEGATVLFDGTNADQFEPAGKISPDGLLMEGVKSKATFGDHTLHIEFRLPYMPKARGQARGNSGLYVQGRYEVQMLDSFGLEGVDNECGGIYKIARPSQNLCYPPLAWQTYDVDFTAAKFDAAGAKTANARITVKHNGYVIHDNIELPGLTGGAQLKDEVGPGPIFLQNHGNPVRYRNIWVVAK